MEYLNFYRFHNDLQNNHINPQAAIRTRNDVALVKMCISGGRLSSSFLPFDFMTWNLIFISFPFSAIVRQRSFSLNKIPLIEKKIER